MTDETDPEFWQGKRFPAYVGYYFQVMEDDCIGHPSVALLNLTDSRLGANSRTSQRQYWLFHHFCKFQKEHEGHLGSYFVNCLYWDDIGCDEAGNLLPTTCLCLGPFFLDDDVSKEHADAVKEELEKFNLWPKTHLRVLGRGY